MYDETRKTTRVIQTPVIFPVKLSEVHVTRNGLQGGKADPGPLIETKTRVWILLGVPICAVIV